MCLTNFPNSHYTQWTLAFSSQQQAAPKGPESDHFVWPKRINPFIPKVYVRVFLTHICYGISAQYQLFSGGPAPVWSSCSHICCWRSYQMSPEWNGLFYHLTQGQLSATHPHTCKGRYMFLCKPLNRPLQSIATQSSSLCKDTRGGKQKYALGNRRLKEWWKYRYISSLYYM